MKHRVRFQFPFLAIPLLLTFACGGKDSEDGESGIDCIAICAHENSLCTVQLDCNMACNLAAQLNKASGCYAEFEAGMRCAAELKVCDDDSTLCPSDDYIGCIEAFCAENPTNSIC